MQSETEGDAFLAAWSRTVLEGEHWTFTNRCVMMYVRTLQVQRSRLLVGYHRKSSALGIDLPGSQPGTGLPASDSSTRNKDSQQNSVPAPSRCKFSNMDDEKMMTSIACPFPSVKSGGEATGFQLYIMGLISLVALSTVMKGRKGSSTSGPAKAVDLWPR